VKGVQKHPQKFSFVENPGKIPENPGKNGAQRRLISKNGANVYRKSDEDLFLEVIPIKGLHDRCGRENV